MSTGAPSSGGIGRTMAQATSFCERLPLTLSTSLGWWNGRQAATFGSHTTHTHTHLYTNTEQQTQYITFLCKSGFTHRRSTPCSFWLPVGGDLEINPGPTQYPCIICSRAYSKRRVAILCVECTGWVCYTKTCSGIANRGHVPQGWKCKRCTPGTTPKHDTNNNNIHGQTDPTSSAGYVDTTTTSSHSTSPIPLKNPPRPPLFSPRPPLLPTPPPSLRFRIRRTFLPTPTLQTLPLLHHPPYPPVSHPPLLHLPNSVLIGLCLIPSTFCR